MKTKWAVSLRDSLTFACEMNYYQRSSKLFNNANNWELKSETNSTQMLCTEYDATVIRKAVHISYRYSQDAIALPDSFVSARVINVWNNLPDSTDFRCLRSFNRSVSSVYLSKYCKVNFL